MACAFQFRENTKHLSPFCHYFLLTASAMNAIVPFIEGFHVVIARKELISDAPSYHDYIGTQNGREKGKQGQKGENEN
jgi:hypothetical protein